MNRFVAQCLGRDYDVISAFDGREGLEKALRFRPMLVVSDIMMPNVSGVEMIARDAQARRSCSDADPAALGEGRRRADGASSSTRARRTSSSSRSPSASCVVRVRNLVLASRRARKWTRLREAGRSAPTSAQGRVPGDARPRAAQSARADPDRAAADEAARRSRIRARAHGHRAPGQPPRRGWSTTCSTSRASRAARSS